MSSLTANMGLTKWDQTTDFFSYTELANNLTKLDAHDHSPGNGLPVPGSGILAGTITKEKLSSEVLADIEPRYSTWKTISVWGGNNGAGGTNLTYGLGPSGIITPTKKGNAAFYFDPAIYAAGTRTVQMRLRYTILIGSSVISATAWTYQLYPVTNATGGANLLDVTLGTEISSAALVMNNPGINVKNIQSSAAFTAPAAGFYIITWTPNGAYSASLVTRAIVQIRQV